MQNQIFGLVGPGPWHTVWDHIANSVVYQFRFDGRILTAYEVQVNPRGHSDCPAGKEVYTD